MISYLTVLNTGATKINPPCTQSLWKLKAAVELVGAVLEGDQKAPRGTTSSR